MFPVQPMAGSAKPREVAIRPMFGKKVAPQRPQMPDTFTRSVRFGHAVEKPASAAPQEATSLDAKTAGYREEIDFYIQHRMHPKYREMLETPLANIQLTSVKPEKDEPLSALISGKDGKPAGISLNTNENTLTRLQLVTALGRQIARIVIDQRKLESNDKIAEGFRADMAPQDPVEKTPYMQVAKWFGVDLPARMQAKKALSDDDKAHYAALSERMASLAKKFANPVLTRDPKSEAGLNQALQDCVAYRLFGTANLEPEYPHIVVSLYPQLLVEVDKALGLK